MSATNFANSKKRVIMMSKKNVPYVLAKGADGKMEKRYKPKAAFRKQADGSMRSIDARNKSAIPNKVMPAALKGRKARSNTGVARGARGPREGALLRMMNTESRKMAMMRRRAAARKAMAVSPGGTIYKSKRAMDARRRAAARKAMVNALTTVNPFAALTTRAARRM